MSNVTAFEKPLKTQANEKMLIEMDADHTGAEDVIHNWLCDQDSDKELYAGILKEDRTIKGALQYCANQAKKQKTGNVAMIDDNTVFGWVREYFVSDDIDVSALEKELMVSTSEPAAKPVAKKKPKVKKAKKEISMDVFQGEQLDLLDLL